MKSDSYMSFSQAQIIATLLISCQRESAEGQKWSEQFLSWCNQRRAQSQTNFIEIAGLGRFTALDMEAEFNPKPAHFLFINV